MADRFYSGQLDYVARLNELASPDEINTSVASLVTNISNISSTTTTAKDQAIAAWAASTAPAEQLASFSPSIHVGAVVKSIIYDTSKDSDGGAWRKRCTDKSWYNETLGGVAWVGQQASEAIARAYIGSRASTEIVTNGAFTTDTSGWTAVNSTLSVVSGAMRVTQTAVGAYAYQAITCVIGKTYTIQAACTAEAVTGNIFLQVGTNAGGAQNYASTNASTFTALGSFTATATTHYVALAFSGSAVNGETADFDNISVKLVDSTVSATNYLYQSTVDGKFYKLNQTSGTTEVFRGISKEFPALVAIIAESARVVIYDLTQASCPMWMVFNCGAGGYLAASVSSVAIINGILAVSQNDRTVLVYFPRDSGSRTHATASNYYLTNIAARNSSLVLGPVLYISFPPPGAHNDVAITVLDTAPIDPATSLPVPTIAVATAGGVSVIKDDGTVVNSSQTERTDSVGFVGSTLFMGNRYATTATFRFQELSTIGASWTPTPGMDYLFSGGAEDQTTITPTPSYIAHRLGTAFTLNKLNKAIPSKSMRCRITNAYNSGWQVGDSRLAALADTTAETVTASGELVTNGTFTTDTSGWASASVASSTASVVSGEAQVTATVGYGRQIQTLTCIVGKTYTLSGSIRSISGSSRASLGVTTFSSGANATVIGNNTLTAASSVSANFIATQALMYVVIGDDVNIAGGVMGFDNISVKLADADRSVKNTGLVVNGSLTKTAVASGAGLVAYSGFSASNYLEQPYSANLDFGTGDFCVMGWVNPTGSSGSSYGAIIDRTSNKAAALNAHGIVLYSGTGVSIAAYIGATALAGALNLNQWNFVVLLRVGGVGWLYVNGAVAQTTEATANITDTSATTTIGGYWLTSLTANNYSVALVRVSASAPSADQIAHIYRTELPLFQPNAQCTIAGTSTAVTALAYDDVADTLQVGTSWGRTSFRDLLRIDSEATSTGAVTSLSANESVVLTGGASSGKVYAPAMYLRDELRRNDAARKALGRLVISQEFTATASQTVFTVRKGYDVKFVYVNGLLKRSVIDYNVTDDGFQETVTMLSGVPVGQAVTLMIVRG